MSQEKSAIMRWCENQYPEGGCYVIVYRKVVAKNAHGEPYRWQTTDMIFSLYQYIQDSHNNFIQYFWNGKAWSSHEWEEEENCNIKRITSGWTLRDFLIRNRLKTE